MCDIGFTNQQNGFIYEREHCTMPGISVSSIITDIMQLDNADDIKIVFDAANKRAKQIREITGLENKAKLQPGTRVVTTNLKPKYLSGLRGVVAEGESRRRGDLPIIVDEHDRTEFNRKYISPTTGRINVPASSLRLPREGESHPANIKADDRGHIL
jgi:hypothetical protein